jgi:hypothetical protein
MTVITQTPAAAVQPRIFICADCGQQHNSPVEAIPQGWDLLAMDCSGTPFVRCSDCVARVDQATFDRMADYMANHHGKAVTGLDSVNGPDMTAAAARIAETWRVTTPAASPFHTFLEKQESGEYRIALTPEAVLMRWLPLGFFLTPAEARATARELLHYAAQAERPGKLAEREGAEA